MRTMLGSKPRWHSNRRVEITQSDDVFTTLALKQVIPKLLTICRVNDDVLVLARKLPEWIDPHPRVNGFF